MKYMSLILVALALILGVASGAGEQCGSQAGGAVCANGLCCSQYGYCGSTSDYCGTNCKSQSGGTSSSGGGISSLVSSSMFEQMLKHRNDSGCEAKGFYTYNAFITAAKSFSSFATTGNLTVQKREIAAFLGQTSHETTGTRVGKCTRRAWGYCYIREINRAAYCEPSQGPCASGKLYYGRGPIQLTYNYNYQQAGNAIGVDLINNPDLVATDAVISFKTAIWFWMTAQGNKPSCHDVITGKWTPSATDNSAGRVTGYGVITNIINGGLECGIGQDSRVADRIGFYKRYRDMMGVSYGDNLDCYSQKSFA